MNTSKSILGLGLLLCSLSTQAVIVTDQWTASITQVINNTAFSVGDSISWTVTYDDASTVMNYYNDSTDGIGQTADDISYIAGTSCPTCTYTLTANATTNVDHLVTQMISGITNYGSPFDFYNINYDRFYEQRFPQYTYNELVVDDLRFLADNYNGGSRNLMTLYYLPAGSSQYSASTIRWGLTSIESNIQVTPEPANNVPEAPIMAFMLVGLAGLTLTRRKKHCD